MLRNQHMNRRTFLKSQVATGAAAAAGVLPVHCGSSNTDDDFGGFQIGVHSFCFKAFNHIEAIELASKLGLSQMELFPKQVQFVGNNNNLRERSNPPYYDNPAAWQTMQQALRKHGFSTPVAGCVETFSTDHEHNKKIFEWAKQAGIKSLSAVGVAKHKLDSLERLTQEYGISIGAHNHGKNDKNAGTVDILKEIFAGRHTSIGLCSDTAFWFGVGQDPCEAMKMFSDRLHNVHIRDVAPDTANPGKTVMVPLGEGIYDYRPVFVTLREIGYTGPVTLEMVVPYDDPLTMLQKSIVNLKEIIQSV